MRILSFNVNGIRSLRDDYRKTHGWCFADLLGSLQADIICMQETKANKAEMIDHDIGFPAGYHAYFAFPRIPKKIGYAGVVTFVRDGVGHPAVRYHDRFLSGAPLRGWTVEELEALDSEGRVMVTDHGAFLLLNVYFPNYGGPERADFRNRFYTAFTDRCDELIGAGRSIVIATDFNTTFHPIDHCDFVKPFLEEIVGTSSFDEANRFVNETASWLIDQVKRVSDREFPSMQDVDDLLAANPLAHPALPALLQTFFREKGSRLWAFMYLREHKIIDCFRLHHEGEPNRFTCWNTLIGARGGNYGTRIDYILAGGPLFADALGVVKDSGQMYDYMGSDHCPVWADFDFPVHEESDRMKTPALAANIRKQQRLDSFFKSKSASTKVKTTTAVSTVMQTAGSTVKIEKSCSMSIAARNTLFGVKNEATGVVELCDGHREPCKEWTVKKPGPNKGKRFYLCARPVGIGRAHV